MCQQDSADRLESVVFQTAEAAAATAASPGSRRRRLWELESHAHCPIVGVCLPIAALRRLVDKVLGGQAVADAYELHCGVIADCKPRTPLAEALQRELDRRCAPALRVTAKAKNTEALATCWDELLRGGDLAGALWATLTHARCTPELAHRVLGAVHMLQHHAGVSARVDLDRFDAVVEENAVLTRELADAQRRAASQAAEQARSAEAQQQQMVQLRAQLIARDTALYQLRDDLHALHATVPGLKSRMELTREGQLRNERLQQVEHALLQTQQEAERQRQRALALAAELQFRDAQDADILEPDADMASPPARFDAQAVLCVGGRPAAVPLYRHIVERVGGRFLHHDGGEEESHARLDATLAAADMVICQSGCISHNAYWRVKDHCKRTGKRCVFVATPSAAGIKRALIALAPG